MYCGLLDAFLLCRSSLLRICNREDERFLRSKGPAGSFAATGEALRLRPRPPAAAASLRSPYPNPLLHSPIGCPPLRSLPYPLTPYHSPSTPFQYPYPNPFTHLPRASPPPPPSSHSPPPSSLRLSARLRTFTHTRRSPKSKRSDPNDLDPASEQEEGSRK